MRRTIGGGAAGPVFQANARTGVRIPGDLSAAIVPRRKVLSRAGDHGLPELRILHRHPPKLHAFDAFHVSDHRLAKRRASPFPASHAQFFEGQIRRESARRSSSQALPDLFFGFLPDRRVLSHPAPNTPGPLRWPHEEMGPPVAEQVNTVRLGDAAVRAGSTKRTGTISKRSLMSDATICFISHPPLRPCDAGTPDWFDTNDSPRFGGSGPRRQRTATMRGRPHYLPPFAICSSFQKGRQVPPTPPCPLSHWTQPRRPATRTSNSKR